MREKGFSGVLAAAGALGIAVAGVYMSRAPDIARMLGTAAFVLFWIGMAGAVFVPRGRIRAKWMEYLLVGGVSGVVGIVAWWILGLAPAEAKAPPPPDLKAEIQQDGDGYFLVVENHGGQGVIWADIKVQARHNFEGGSDQRIYPGYWEATRNGTTTLLPRQRDRLVLGGVRDSSILIGTAGGALDRKRLLFVFHDPGAKNGRGVLYRDWAPNKKPQPPAPILFLGVTLHANPLLPYEPSGVYQIDMNGIFEHQPMSTTPRSP